jgi:formate-dependent phosphoribosylglycinamide formyltransferase (GAR transformylase)
VSTNVVFVGADLFPAFQDFARGLQQAGARVTGVGSTPKASLRAGLKRWIDDWVAVRSPFDGEALARELRRQAPGRTFDRLEAVDERLIVPAAVARQRLGLPGQSVDSARLCRDKPLMKEALRKAGLPCAESAAVASTAELERFVERVGYPVVLKPRAGLGSLETFRVASPTELSRAAKALHLDRGESIAVEEFVEGHEGFYDTLAIDGVPRLDFVSHYFPAVLEALSDRRAAPQIAATNRVELASYDELRAAGAEVIRALGIGTAATHMEWFFGPKGLKVSEIGARPPGERIWDLYCVGNDLDLYRLWGEAVASGRVTATPSRRFATGSVQVRPDRDGKIVSYEGVDRVAKRFGAWIWQHDLPRPGRRTVPIEKGYLANAWFRLRHPDYDELRRMMDVIGRTVRVHAAAS